MFSFFWPKIIQILKYTDVHNNQIATYKMSEQSQIQKVSPSFGRFCMFFILVGLTFIVGCVCLLRRREPAEEEDGLGLIVPDEKEEGVVCCEVFLPEHTE